MFWYFRKLDSSEIMPNSIALNGAIETFAFKTQECFMCIHLCTHKIRLGDVILILFAHQMKLSLESKTKLLIKISNGLY